MTRLNLEGIDREHVKAMWRLPWWVPAAALAWALISIVATAVRGGPAGAFVYHGVIAAVVAASLVLLRHGGGAQVTQLEEDRVGTGTRTWRGQLDPEWVPWSDVDHINIPGPWEDEAHLVLRAGDRERTLPGLPAEQARRLVQALRTAQGVDAAPSQDDQAGPERRRGGWTS